MKEIKKNEIDSSIEGLLAYAASDVQTEIKRYQTEQERLLFGIQKKNGWAGCIGIRELALGEIEIIHIAVALEYRGTGIGKKMIQQISRQHNPARIKAETDKDAVDFYKRCGFSITSLGGKYPGIERFLCTKDI